MSPFGVLSLFGIVLFVLLLVLAFVSYKTVKADKEGRGLDATAWEEVGEALGCMFGIVLFSALAYGLSWLIFDSIIRGG